MGSPLRLVLANIFMGYCEEKIQKNTCHFSIIAMSMTLSLFSDQAINYAGDFHQLLNSIHPSLKFTREDGEGDKLAFLDTDISRRGPPLLRSIYRKKTITGLYIRYDSFLLDTTS